MTRDGGDQAFHGDKVSYETAQDIEPGMLVGPSGDMVVDKVDSASGPGVILGVMTDDTGRYGPKTNVVQRGVVKVRAEDDVAAGDELSVPDTGTGVDSDPDTAGVAVSGGGTGIPVVRGAEQDADGNYYCLVHLG